MKILLGNFAGAHSNLGKFLTWCLIKKPEDKIFFIYWNKGIFNDHPEIWPINEFPKEQNKNFFYKYFEFPKDATVDDFFTPDLCVLNYPCFGDENLKSLVPLTRYPKELHPYNGFFFQSKIFADPNFNTLRKMFHDIWMEHLRPTEHLQTLMKDDIAHVQSYLQKGKVLCVMIRCPFHFVGGFDTEAMFDEIKEKMKSFDFILPITQQANFYDMLLTTYGERCIQLNRKRLPFNVDWIHVQYTDKEFEDEFAVAVKDSYLASMCNTIMGGSSGLFFSAFILNPTAEVIVFDAMKTKDAY